MGQTAMQKILASHAGKKSLETASLIRPVDLAMATTSRAPISIKAL